MWTLLVGIELGSRPGLECHIVVERGG
jgi:hypothetical protein